MPRAPSVRLALVLGALVVSACSGEALGSRVHPLLGRTGELLDGTRPMLGRLSTERHHRPCTLGASRLDGFIGLCREPLDPARLRAQMLLSAEVHRAVTTGDAGALWAAALLDLTSSGGRADLLERAVNRLDDARVREPANARLLNDLALAYGALAASRRTALDAYSSLDVIEQAMRLDSSSAAIRFNRAMLLDDLALTAMALDGWTSLVARYPRDEWAAEATSRRQRLELVATDTALDDGDARPRALTRSLEDERETVIGRLLPAWAAAVMHEDSAAAARALASARTIAANVYGRSRDSTVLHLVRECSDRSAPHALALAAAVTQAASGARMFDRGQSLPSAVPLRAASVELRKLGASAQADWSDLLLGVVATYGGKYAEAEKIFTRVHGDATKREDLALAAKALWARALSQAKRGDLSGATRDYQRAASIFENTRQLRDLGRVRTQLAQVLVRLGRDDAAAMNAMLGLEPLRDRRKPADRHDALMALGMQLEEAGLPYAAAVTFREAVIDAPRTVRARDQAESLIRLAGALGKIGDGDIALAALTRADSVIGALDDSLAQPFLLGNAAATRAGLMKSASGSEIDASLARALQQFATTGNAFVSVPLVMRRGRSSLQHGDTASAERHLHEAQELVSRMIGREDSRMQHRQLADAWRGIHETLLALALGRGDTVGALVLAERMRGATVDGKMEEGWRGRSPELGTAILSYAVLENECIIWLIHDGHIRMHRSAIARSRLSDLSQRFERSLRQGADHSAPLDPGGELHAILVGTILDDVPIGTNLVIVADGALSRISFAALRTRTGYLVERHPIAYAERSSVRVRLADGVSSVRRGTALIVGDPAFDAQLFPTLAPLSGALAETEALAALHPRATVLRGTEVTRQKLLEEIPRHGLMHFAGHAEAGNEDADGSFLVLSKTSGGVFENSLSGPRIRGLDLRGVRLVVLASCGSSQSVSRRTQSLRSIAADFLDAGAAAVISSRWEVDDASTGALMIRLHGFLARGDAGA
ncbi:MAG: CHAT domain-containing protein, partial [Gemmatimonadaceae bacterium]